MSPEHTEYAKNEKQVLVEARGLHIDFPVKKEMLFAKPKYLQAVSDVSVQIHKGETFGLVGESGCGKSTWAEKLVSVLPAEKRVYIATMQVYDEESVQRVARHRAQRAD